MVMTAGPPRKDGRRWEGRIVLGEVKDFRRAITLEPMPGSEGEVGGSAWYEIDVEYAEQSLPREEPYNYDDLEPTITELVTYTRTLVGRLTATVWPDHLTATACP